MAKSSMFAMAVALLMLLAVAIKVLVTNPERSYASRVRELAVECTGAGDVCLHGTLGEGPDGDLILQTQRGEYALVLPDAQDFSAQIGSRCEVFGTQDGSCIRVSTPRAHCILFADGSVYTPPFLPGDEPERQVQVWVSTKGGTKYHTRPDCSRMTEACQLTLYEASALGYTPCSRCQ